MTFYSAMNSIAVEQIDFFLSQLLSGSARNSPSRPNLRSQVERRSAIHSSAAKSPSGSISR